MDSKPTSDAEMSIGNPNQHTEEEKSHPQIGDGASPGKIFIGGLAKETTSLQFTKHFGKYGEITDSVIMKDRRTGHPRGFGFVTYADPSVVDKVIQDSHVINGKTVEIKRTIPKGAIGAKDFRTKKIFVGGIPTTVSEDEFKEFFSKYGEIKEHQIMRDHSTSRSRGFGFITFDSDQSVDDLLIKGNKIEFSGTQVEIKKAEPKKASNPPPPKHYADPRPAYGSGGFGDTYGSYGGGGGGGGGGYGGSAYRSGGAFGGRPGGYGGYSGSDFGGGYGGYGGTGLGAYRGESSVGYASRYGGSLGRGYDLGGYGGASDGYGGYGSGGGGGGGYGGAYDSGLGGGYGGSGGAFYGSRGGYGGSGGGRYHPYAR